jgi:hypothetical protein
VVAFLQVVAADYKAALEAVLKGDNSAGAPTNVAAPQPDPVDVIGSGVVTILQAARLVSQEVGRRADEEAEALLRTARAEASATVDQSMREAEHILANARSRVEQLIREEHELGNWLRAMRADIQSLLDRKLPAPPPTDSDVERHNALELEQGPDVVDVRDSPLGAIGGPSESLERFAL